ncbi:IS110 family RNA-guided transposase [Tsuneonella sp. HG222]
MSQELHFVGLDVSQASTSIAVCNSQAQVLHESKVATDPEAIARWLSVLQLNYGRVGLEAGPSSAWLHDGLVKAGLPAICIDPRLAHLFNKMQINKNDRNDARGIARMMAMGVFKRVHVKSLDARARAALLVARKTTRSKMLATQNAIRGELKVFGFQVGQVGRRGFAARVEALIADDPILQRAIGPLLSVWRSLGAEFDALHASVLEVVRDDPVCRLLMTTPGVGPVVALTYMTAIDDPARFASSKHVAAYLGLTARQHQSGETNRMLGIAKVGPDACREALYEAATVLLHRVGRDFELRRWGRDVAQRRGRGKAVIAVARRLAIILHQMWITHTPFRWEASV